MRRLLPPLALAAAAASTVGALPSSAATITADDSRDVAIIRVRGELNLGDEDRFLDLALARRTAIVTFDSPGGNLKAGIEIGKFIRLRNYTTIVSHAAVCASACALAWLGGGKRVMSSRANVGFHAAYMSSGSGHEVTGSGNALVGAYLSKLGFTSPAIVYITSAAPNEMNWLTAERASMVGLDVDVLNPREGDDSPAPPQPSAPPRPIAPTASVNWSAQGIWVQTASRASLQDAIEIAVAIRAKNPNTAIFQYRNGWYGVVIGPFAPESGERRLRALLAAREVPADSLLTLGEAFSMLQWGNPQPRGR
jgi:hypothetical protein